MSFIYALGGGTSGLLFLTRNVLFASSRLWGFSEEGKVVVFE
jgi:hypothetical protein